MKKLLLGILLTVSALTSFASNWPNRPVTLVVPFAAGSYSTMIANALQAEFEARFKTPVIVKYMPGAGSLVAVNHVLNTDNDNHTIILFNDDFIAAQHTQGTNLHDQFVPVNIFSRYGIYIYGNSNASTEKFKNTIKNGVVNVGNMGAGGAYDIWTRQLKYPGMTVNPIPYKGGAPMQADVLGGHLDYGLSNLVTARALVEEGKLKPVAISTLERNHIDKDVPTFRELGIQGEPFYGFFGIFTRKDTPQEAVDAMSKILQDIVATNATFKNQAAAGINVANLDSAKSKTLVLETIRRLNKMMQK